MFKKCHKICVFERPLRQLVAEGWLSKEGDGSRRLLQGHWEKTMRACLNSGSYSGVAGEETNARNMVQIEPIGPSH